MAVIPSMLAIKVVTSLTAPKSIKTILLSEVRLIKFAGLISR